MIARSTFLAGLSLLFIALLNGCASYQLGSAAPIDFDSIYIRPAKNESYAPQAQALVSSQLRETFIKDGRVKLVSDEAEADAILEVTLTEYDRRSGARRSDDTLVARTLDLELTAEISLYDVNEGNYYFQNRKLKQDVNVYTDNPYLLGDTSQAQGNYMQAEYDAMPRIARGLARKITDEVLSPWPTHEEEQAAAEAKLEEAAAAEEETANAEVAE